MALTAFKCSQAGRPPLTPPPKSSFLSSSFHKIEDPPPSKSPRLLLSLPPSDGGQQCPLGRVPFMALHARMGPLASTEPPFSCRAICPQGLALSPKPRRAAWGGSAGAGGCHPQRPCQPRAAATPVHSPGCLWCQKVPLCPGGPAGRGGRGDQRGPQQSRGSPTMRLQPHPAGSWGSAREPQAGLGIEEATLPHGSPCFPPHLGHRLRRARREVGPLQKGQGWGDGGHSPGVHPSRASQEGQVSLGVPAREGETLLGPEGWEDSGNRGPPPQPPPPSHLFPRGPHGALRSRQTLEGEKEKGG